MQTTSSVAKALKIALPAIAVGAGIYFLLHWYFGPLTPKAESRLSDVVRMLQFFVVSAGWIHALRQNKRLRGELEALQKRAGSTSTPISSSV